MTKDPVTGEELIVTRLESLSGITIEGQFSLGWIARLTPDQIEFVGLLLKNRGNVQKLAAELNVSYNTARNRMDEVVAALGVPPEPSNQPDHTDVLDRLQSGDISFDEAVRRLEE